MSWCTKCIAVASAAGVISFLTRRSSYSSSSQVESPRVWGHTAMWGSGSWRRWLASDKWQLIPSAFAISRPASVLCEEEEDNDAWREGERRRRKKKRSSRVKVGVAQFQGSLGGLSRYVLGHMKPRGRRTLMVAVVDSEADWQIAELLASRVGTVVENKVSEAEVLTDDVVIEAFRALDDEVKQKLHKTIDVDSWTRGAASLVCVLVDPFLVTVASAGRSKAVLCRNGQVVELNRMHSAEFPEERSRIAKEHPGDDDAVKCRGDAETDKVDTSCRVKGYSRLTRGIGHFGLKKPAKDGKPYLTVDPEVVRVTRQSSSDAFLIVASGAFWDEVSEEEAVRVAASTVIANEGDSTVSRLVAQALVDLAANRIAKRSSSSDSIIDLVNMERGKYRSTLHRDISVVFVPLQGRKREKHTTKPEATHEM